MDDQLTQYIKQITSSCFCGPFLKSHELINYKLFSLISLHYIALKAVRQRIRQRIK